MRILSPSLANKMRMHSARLLFVNLLLLFATCANASKGVVAYVQSGCDWYIFSTQRGYVLAEWYGGVEPDKGDLIAGEFESYGMHDVFNIAKDASVHVWIDDYLLSRDSVIEKYRDKCPA